VREHAARAALGVGGEQCAELFCRATAQEADEAGGEGPDVDAHVARILASAASDTGDDACLLAVRIR